MEGIKEAFSRVKEDIDLLRSEVSNLNNNLSKTKESFSEMCDIVSIVSKKNAYLELENMDLNKKVDLILDKLDALLAGNSTQSNDSLVVSDKSLDIETDISTGNDGVETNVFGNKTIKTHIRPGNNQNQHISIGNQGVQTDIQTIKQTDIRQENSSYNQEEILGKSFNNISKPTANSIDSAVEVLDSLDSLKREIRLKFKRLTDQEILVFSTIYQLEEEFGYSDYKTIAKKINLTESSIRDYVRRLINKGIPIVKNKINNKEIKLSVSINLKKIATLNTILELRDL